MSGEKILNIYEGYEWIDNKGNVRLEKSIAERFEEYVGVVPWEVRRRCCLEWQGANSVGYGMLFFSAGAADWHNLPVKGTMQAHRLSKIIAEGCDWISRWLVVHHVCNNPACCNPLHLEITTHAGNLYEARKDGLMENARLASSCLKDEDVREIRLIMRDVRIRNVDIAEEFGVRPAVISNIRNNVTYRHVTI